MAAVAVCSSWIKVGSSGQAVTVQNNGLFPVVLEQGGPSLLAPVSLLNTTDSYSGTPAADLYACCLAGGLAQLSVSGGGGTGSNSSPGGGPNNTADMSDPNNAYLVAVGTL